jgi:hypothetical protein
MSMRRPRYSIQWLTAVVIALAVALGVGRPAFLAWRDDEGHAHTFIDEEPPRQFFSLETEFASPPIWARYWGHIFGRDRRGSGDCGSRLGRIEEVCAWEHPEVASQSASGIGNFRATPRQRAELNRLNSLVGTPLSSPDIGNRQ